MSYSTHRRSMRAILGSAASTVALGALLQAVAVGGAYAQNKAAETKDEATEVETVVVTGSFLRGTPTTATLPVEAASLEEMRDKGNPSPVEFIKQMSEVGSTVGEANRNNLFAVGAAAINLRSLGANRTVVLFNGRRWPETFSFSVGRYININQMPGQAVGRIETLKDGGATTYGADAVGGVVNYITRKGFNGIEANATYQYVKGSEGNYEGSLLFGKSVDNFSILAMIGYEHKSQLSFSDRDWSKVPYLKNPASYVARGNPGSFMPMINTAGTGQGGTFTAITATGAGNALYTGNRQIGPTGIMRDPNCQALGGFAGWNSTISNAPTCWDETSALSNLQEKQNQWHGYIEGNYEFSDKLKLHTEFVYYSIDVPEIPLDTFTNRVTAWPLVRDTAGQIVLTGGAASSQTAGGVLAYYTPGTNPAVGNFLNLVNNANGSSAFTSTQLTNLTSANGRIALPQELWRPFGVGGGLYGQQDYQHNKSNQYRYTAELSGELGKFGPTSWDWSAAYTLNNISYHYFAPDIPVDRLQAALNGLGGPNCTGNTPGAENAATGLKCYYFNPFSTAVKQNVFTGAINPNYVGAGTYTGYDAGTGLTNSPTLLKWLYSSPAQLQRDMDYTVVDVLLRGDLGIKLWADDTITLGVGAQYRELHETEDTVESHDLIVNPCATAGVQQCGTQRNGTTVYQRGALVTGFRTDYDRRYPVYASFAETRIPITNSLNAQASVRWEKFFSDVGAQDNETVVAAGGLRWQATPWLALRGTAGQSFGQISPPAPAEAFISGSTTIPAGFGGNPAVGTPAFNTVNYANTGIKPETGFNYNIGAVIQAGDVLATLDYYHIRINTITTALAAGSVQSAITDPTTAGAQTLVNCSSPLFTTKIPEFNRNDGQGARPYVEITNPNFVCTQGVTTMQQFMLNAASGGAAPNFNFFGSQGQENRTWNGPGLTTSGLDLNVKWSRGEFFGGDLSVTADASYILTYKRDATVLGGTEVAPSFDGIGYSNTGSLRVGERVTPWRGSLTLNYHVGRHNFNLLTRLVPGYASTSDSIYNVGSVPTASQNANIPGANGFTNQTYCAVAPYIMTPPIPTGAGTAEFGTPYRVSASTVAIGYDPCQNTAVEFGQKVPATFATDFTYRIALPADTSLSLGVQNLFDTDPQFSRDATNYDPGGAASPLGRTYRFSIVKKW